MRVLNNPVRWLMALTPLTMLACGLDVSEPEIVEPQVIEEITFAESLDIDLSAMEVTGSGVYILDLTMGEGEPVVWGEQVRVAYEGWLNSGTRFDAGSNFGFLMGNNQVIPGFEQGIFGMKLGGKRRMIIPPVLGYGNQGAGAIPPGSVLIFEVELLEIVR